MLLKKEVLGLKEVGRKTKTLVTLSITIALVATLFCACEIIDVSEVKLGVVLGIISVGMLGMGFLASKSLLDRVTTYVLIAVGAGILITVTVLNWVVIVTPLNVLTFIIGILLVKTSYDSLKDEFSEQQSNVAV